jgi:hypothetical protein
MSESGIYVVHDFFLLMGIIQKLPLQTYFPRKINLSITSYGDLTRELVQTNSDIFTGFKH